MTRIELPQNHVQRNTDPIPDDTERVIDLMPFAVLPTSLEPLVVALFKADSIIQRSCICSADVSSTFESSFVAESYLNSHSPFAAA